MTGTKTVSGARRTIWMGLLCLEKCCGLKPGIPFCPACSRNLRAIRWAAKYICGEKGIVPIDKLDNCFIGVDGLAAVVDGRRVRIGYIVGPIGGRRTMTVTGCLTFQFTDSDCPK